MLRFALDLTTTFYIILKKRPTSLEQDFTRSDINS